MRIYLLTTLGSLFWLFLLALGARLVWHHGLYQSSGALDQISVVLLLVPSLMILGTIALGYRARRTGVPIRVIVASSLVAAFALFLCLGGLIGPV